MLGHSIGGGETLGGCTRLEYHDHCERMAKVEYLILKAASPLHTALGPSKTAAPDEVDGLVIKPGFVRKSRR